MKEIVAIIRSNKWQKTRAALLAEDFHSYTIHRVYGRGKQKGLMYLSKNGILEEGIQFLPKRMVTLFIADEEADRVIEIIIQANWTGEIGDGKIFVCPVESIERIRTGERAEEALV